MEAAEDAADDPVVKVAQLAAMREENIKALLSNDLQVQRQPLLSKYLVIREGEQQLRKAFKSPAPGAPAQSNALRKRLLARKHFVPWGSSKPFTLLKLAPPAADAAVALQQELLEAAAKQAAEDAVLPPGIEPLLLWDPAEAGLAGEAGEHAVEVDSMLTRWLRPHQREGVQFMFECVTGLRLAEGRGCILADDMGLGKTLQGISLMWTLLQQGSPALGGRPIAKRAIIVCPTSLVSNWDSECTKWLKGRCRTLALCESSRDDVIDAIARFTAPHSSYHCLIISYETFRLHAPRLTAPGSCDLLICDEAHRLKNDATLTNRALASLPCRRRVLLSGTPMQNHLDEFFAMVDFCNPGVLRSPAEFRKHFEAPILAGREPGASADVAALGEARSSELSGLVNTFILRRSNKLLSDHLPPKVVEVVVCRLGELQRQLYEHFLLSNATRRLLAGSKATGVLSAITSLKKLCNHPKLVYDTLHSKAQVDGAVAEGFEGVGELFPPGLFDNGRPGRGEMALGWEQLSGKMGFVVQLLAVLRQTTDDKVVIVSNYTQTLDLFATLCRQRGYQHLRLDGSTSITKRQKLVGQLNAPGSKVFVFLLSSKAGGCGLNLVGANRLILFDPDWNPATDKQAAARVWRDGQRKRVYVYRLLTAGTIEEKVFQRQISKEGLQQVVDAAAAAAPQGPQSNSLSECGAGEAAAAAEGAATAGSCGRGAGGGQAGPAMSLMSTEELRELFSLRPDVASDTYDVIRGGSERAAAAAAARGAAAAVAAAGAACVELAGEGEGEGAGRHHGYDSSEETEGKDDDDDDDDGMFCDPAVRKGKNSSSSKGKQQRQKQQPDEQAAAAADEAAAAAGAAAAASEYAMLDGHRPQVGQPSEEDLRNFGHHTAAGLATVPDAALQAAAGEFVSFVFSCQVEGRLDMCSQQQQGSGGPAKAAHAAGSSKQQQAWQLSSSGLSRRHPVAAMGSSAAEVGKPSSLQGSSKLRHSAPAALKRPLHSSCGSAGQQQQQHPKSSVRRLSDSSLPMAGMQNSNVELQQQEHVVEKQQQQQQALEAQQQAPGRAHALADASSRLNSSSLPQAGGCGDGKQQVPPQQQQQQQQQQKRQKIVLKPAATGAAALGRVSGDDDSDDFM